MLTCQRRQVRIQKVVAHWIEFFKMLSRFQRSSHYVTRIASARLSSNEIAKQKPVQVVAKEANIPIERTSLSRGLALNKFEKVCQLQIILYQFLFRIS